MGMLQNLTGIPEEKFDTLSHAQLSSMRESFRDNPAVYAALAPYEHQAFAREWTKEQPLLAVPSLTAAIPLQYLAKLSGVMPKMSDAPQTPASLSQVTHGFRGIGQGVKGLFSDYFR